MILIIGFENVNIYPPSDIVGFTPMGGMYSVSPLCRKVHTANKK
jgi:hypothetical protein